MNQPIVAITDRRDLQRFHDRHPAMAMTIVHLGELSHVVADDESILVIDVDLLDPAKVKPLKMHAAFGAMGRRIVLVDRGERCQEVQAKCLGATDIVERPLTARHLAPGRAPNAATIAAPSPARPPPGADRATIQASADLLVSLFAARGSGALVDMVMVNQVGNQVVAAVTSVGLDGWLTTVRAHHAGTFQHCLLVTGVAAAFGRFLGLSQVDLRLLTATALLHDIGKAQIPLQILNKPGRLSDDEFLVMKQHPVIGYDLLVAQPAVPKAALLGVRHHHEYLDGSGYPDGLSGAAIGDITRMLTVADIYGALIEKRAYKKPRTPAEAIPTLQDLAGGGKIDRALTAAMAAMVQS